MKKLQLPKNKFIRATINAAFLAICVPFACQSLD
tara:strand:+ start:84 stop:185 length:102 start_codon:yes stop_codon:yes gene_type:complete